MRFTFRYGIDAPFWVAVNLIIGLVLSIASLFGLPQSLFGLIFGLYILGIGGWMLLYSTVIKLQHRETILDMGEVHRGDHVLDVGTGRGLIAIAAAKRGALVTGIDKWSAWDLGGNGRAALSENAEAENVQNLEVFDGDVRELPFPDNAFDVVVSNFVIHNVKGLDEREKAILQMWRVLRPGGRLVISDIYRADEYVEILCKETQQVTRRKFRSTFPFSQVIVAKKELHSESH